MVKHFFLIVILFCAFRHIPQTEADTLVFSSSSVEPWGYFNDSKLPAGLLVELNKALQEQLQTQVKTHLLFKNHIRPYPRVINDIKTGRADFAVLFYTAESLSYGDTLGEISKFDIQVTGRKNAPEITQLNDLIGKKIGYVRGSKYGPMFDNNEKLSKVSLSSMEKGVDMLLKGRLDALICLDQTLYHSLRVRSVAPSATKTLLVLGSARADLFISKRSDMHSYSPLVKEALVQLHKKGTIKAIFDPNRPR